MRMLAFALAALFGIGLLAAQGAFAQEDCSQIADPEERTECERAQGE